MATVDLPRGWFYIPGFKRAINGRQVASFYSSAVDEENTCRVLFVGSKDGVSVPCSYEVFAEKLALALTGVEWHEMTP